MSLCEDARTLQGDLVDLRHRLHREPEIGLDLPRTQETVLRALAGLPLEVTLGRSLSSVTAVLRGYAPGPTVLLRGDMDALPVTERTGLPYAAAADRMHACGHDLHTTMLAGSARLLAAHTDRLAGNVVFMFQPGEEGQDGAGHMLREGVLEAAGQRPVAAYALHVTSSGLPQGMFTTRRGPILAASDTAYVTVRGAGGHGSMPHLARDPIPAACEMVLALQTLVTRCFDVNDPVVVTVGSMHGGTQHNIIPEEVRFEATVRSFSPSACARARDGIVRVVRGVADAHGVEAGIDYQDGYPATVNNAAEAEFVADTVAELHGEERFTWAAHPQPGAEDFSRVLDEIPGSFVALGATPSDADPDSAAYNHSPLAAFDDAVLCDGAALYAHLALRRLTVEQSLPTR
ncbi:M20 metallopeptidase family protein [Streptomyces geranii]|uniref:M20 metallopeptidase family protein n=1 Tax=Streptomyces geranii TaxID=2058923 RepID=UPI000D02BB06|nr:M20 family metallopeptidase [Streptomyces geranii]